MAAKELKEFTLVNGELFLRGSAGVLARAISKAEVKDEHIHDLSYGDNDISLCGRLQIQGYYWPEMGKDVASIQMNPSM